MRITRLRLRNYRVFADELSLELPPGLVGIYGANGAGKSALVEAIPFALFGWSRTGNDQIRTSGVNEEAVVEVDLEHEGHCYSVRRTISGVNHTVRAQASADGVQVAEGVRDTTRYLRSILGLDDTAFRASVFAEQKQLAAFAATTPSKRRDLVLKLLGITPIDAARDRARRDARAAHGDHERVRALLPDLDTLAATAEQARAAAATTRVAGERAATALDDRRRQLSRARRAHDELAVRAAEYETVMSEGREVRRQRDAVEVQVARLEQELADLAGARARVMALSGAAAGLATTEARLRAAEEVRRAQQALEAVVVGVEPPVPDEHALDTARAAAEEARSVLDAHQAQLGEVRRARELAAAVVRDAARLTDQADCPLCGQCLGTAFEQVQSHRRAELVEAEGRLAERSQAEVGLVQSAQHTRMTLQHLAAELDHARQAHRQWEQRADQARAAQQVLDLALAQMDPLGPNEHAALVSEVERQRQAVADHQRLTGRLERAPQAEVELDGHRHDLHSLGGRLDILREKVRNMASSPEALARARHDLDQAEQAQDAADQQARRSELQAVRDEGRAEEARRTLHAAQEQHLQLATLADQARHLGRLAELLGAFRNELVGAVGPRLSRQAASLFAELTDAEYDELQVDPETYGINICDQGVTYGLERYSGSETDLASLALRVAISEHLCFQSGGQIGLLVLDEIFGPLDTDRQDRMLRALERLGGRFRQILVITHEDDVKDQLPHAIEVVKLPGRRATAHVVENMPAPTC